MCVCVCVCVCVWDVLLLYTHALLFCGTSLFLLSFLFLFLFFFFFLFAPSGFMLGNLPQDQRKLITKEHVCGELIRLLKDPNTRVRENAAESIALLYEY